MSKIPMRPFRAIAPDGTEHEARRVTDFCKKHELPASHVYDALKGGLSHVNGWTFMYFDQVLSGDDDAVESLEDLGLDVSLEELGKRPPDQVRQMIRGAMLKVAGIQARIDAGARDRPVGFDSAKTMKTLRDLAAGFGIDLRDVQDTRSDLERAVDMVDRLLTSPEIVLEECDEVVVAIEKAMLHVRDIGVEYFNQRIDDLYKQSDKGVDPPDPKACWSRLDKWLALLRKVRKIRRWARDPIPTEAHEGDLYLPRFADGRVWEATHSLRYMLFVGRSDLKGDKPSDLVFKIGRHIVKTAMDVWEAWERVGFTKLGVLKPGEKARPTDDLPFEGVQYQGVQIMQPPRHSKTSFLRHWLGLMISIDPRTKAAYTHNRGDGAKEFLAHVGALFDVETATGRRNYTVYPFRLAEFDNKSNKLRLHTDDRMKDPNLVAAGLTEAAQGKDLNILIGDDLVSQKDAEEPGTRLRTISRWRGTWLTRLEESVGKKTRGGFFILSGYPWHNNDLMWEEAKQARLASRTNGTQGVVSRLSVQPVGGPPNFTPIWAEVWSAAKLRYRFRQVGPAIWAANYQLNPNTDEMRIVRRVALFDVDDPMHRQFLAESDHQLSIDPTADDKESSDKAGIVTAAVGETVAFRRQGDQFVETRRIKVRVLDAEELHAGQTDLAESIGNRVYMQLFGAVYIEIVTGLGGPIRDHLMQYHGLSNIIECKPHNRNKAQRLKAVAPMIEAYSDHYHPVVEFAGRKDADGNLAPANDGIKRLIAYIVNFRTTSGHHTLDALTQMLAKLAPQIGTMSKDSETPFAGRSRFDGTRKTNHLRSVMKKQAPASDDDAVGEMMEFCQGGAW